MILLVDTETSNIGTWKRILEKLGEKYTLSSDNLKFSKKIKKIIFPGIGNYGHVINNLKKNKVFFILQDLINSDVPYLGVCIGMQILFKKSEESPKTEGMDIIQGIVRKLEFKNIPCPHNGWNNIIIKKDQKIFSNVEKKKDLYFNHSFYCSCKSSSDITSTLSDNSKIITSIKKGKVIGLQFHPEKSMSVGIQIIKNFLDI